MGHGVFVIFSLEVCMHVFKALCMSYIFIVMYFTVAFNDVQFCYDLEQRSKVAVKLGNMI